MTSNVHWRRSQTREAPWSNGVVVEDFFVKSFVVGSAAPWGLAGPRPRELGGTWEGPSLGGLQLELGMFEQAVEEHDELAHDGGEGHELLFAFAD